LLIPTTTFIDGKHQATNHFVHQKTSENTISYSHPLTAPWELHEFITPSQDVLQSLSHSPPLTALPHLHTIVETCFVSQSARTRATPVLHANHPLKITHRLAPLCHCLHKLVYVQRAPHSPRITAQSVRRSLVVFQTPSKLNFRSKGCVRRIATQAGGACTSIYHL
jgi:hypothetical protein